MAAKPPVTELLNDLLDWSAMAQHRRTSHYWTRGASPDSRRTCRHGSRMSR